MKNPSPKSFSVAISLFMALLSGTIIAINMFVDIGDQISLLIFSVLLIFIVAYIPSFYVFNNFIIRQLRPIYSKIDRASENKDEELYKHIEADKDIFAEVDKEVIDWAENRAREIRELKANEKYRKEFLGDVSHELKTPLFNIQGYVLTLIDGGLDDKSINMSYLLKTEKNINRLISIVKDLETISKLESGQLNLNIQEFNFTKLVFEVFDMEEITAQEFGVNLVLENSSTEEIIVRADKKRIFDVLNNLVLNSIKYGRANGTTKVKCVVKGEKIEVFVSDNGIGITKQDIGRIFERFYRVDKSRSRDQGGTGLGLAIVKHVLEGHGQTISVESEFGKGSTFKFTLDKA